MADLVSRKDVLDEVETTAYGFWHHEVIRKAYEYLVRNIKALPAVDAVVLPCRIGDTVWAIRNYRGVKLPQEGIVSEMFFTPKMQLMIVVKYVSRGVWGEGVFATEAEAEKAIRRKERK